MQTRHVGQLLLALHRLGARDGRHGLLALDLAPGLVAGEAAHALVRDGDGVVVLVVGAVQLVGGVVRGVVGPCVVGGRSFAAVLVVELVVAAGARVPPLQQGSHKIDGN